MSFVILTNGQIISYMNTIKFLRMTIDSNTEVEGTKSVHTPSHFPSSNPNKNQSKLNHQKMLVC